MMSFMPRQRSRYISESESSITSQQVRQLYIYHCFLVQGDVLAEGL
jgi:hypothetical protein